MALWSKAGPGFIILGLSRLHTTTQYSR